MPEDARFDILVWTDTKSIQKKGTHDIKSITEKKKKTFDGYPFEGDFLLSPPPTWKPVGTHQEYLDQLGLLTRTVLKGRDGRTTDNSGPLQLSRRGAVHVFTVRHRKKGALGALASKTPQEAKLCLNNQRILYWRSRSLDRFARACRKRKIFQRARRLGGFRTSRSGGIDAFDQTTATRRLAVNSEAS